jgi:CRP-like cAMP-binding protein
MAQTILDAARDHPALTFAPGEVLIAEGTKAPPIFVLLSGTVSVYRGNVRVSRTSLEGALFGEMSILLGIPSTATVIAETPVRAARIEDSAAFLAERPEVALHAAKLLAQRLYDATTYLADLKSQFMDEESHLGMVDRILGSLLTQQLEPSLDPKEDREDPRL